MKLNLKKKVMLAVLAGNMLCMGQGLALNGWYGDTANPNQWKGVIGPNLYFPPIYMNDIVGRATGANLVINGTGTYDGVDFSAAKYIFAGYFKGNEEVTGNQLTVTGGTFANGVNVYAGYGDTGATGVSGNILKIIDCSHDTSSSSSTYNLFGGNGQNGVPVSGNKVWITGGNFVTNASSYIYGGRTAGADATGNVVIIEGGTFDMPMIYGGHGSNAIDNTVEISGGTFDTDGFFLYGGYSSSGTSSGNILNLKIKMTGRANSVSHFQIMNFTLPAGSDDGTPMLKTTDMKFDATNTTTINVDASAATLNNGDIITLIASENPPAGSWTAGTVTGAEGTITLDGNNIIFTATGTSGGDEDQEKAPIEGIAAAVQTVNMSADLASGEGMNSLIAETAGGLTNTFGALTKGQSKYKTGSHVDVDGWGILVGAGKTKEWKNGSATTYGLFFEYGKGDFDTYNGNVHGDGNSENKGVGIMIRHQLANNVYFEGNVRYGKQETEWSESELGGYETDSKYHGAMVGFGKVYKKGNNKLDTYLRYAYGHVGACDATLKDGTDYHFESVKSHRVRTGVRYTFGQRETGFKPYIGAAWEHEFDGEARASISGIGEAPAPSMKGNTGIFELGFDWDDDSKWVVGLGANAYIGKRKGWDGMARVFYNF